MKKSVLLALLVAGLLAVFALSVFAAEQTAERAVMAGEKPKIVSTKTTTATINVIAVDMAKRTVMFKSPEGVISTYRVRKEGLKYLAGVKAGDTLDAKKVSRVAIYARKSVGGGKDKPSMKETYTLTRAPKGAPAGFVAVDETTLTGRVQLVQYKQRLLTITGPAGKTKKFAIDSSVKNLDDLKPGDVVVVLSTDTLTVATAAPR